MKKQQLKNNGVGAVHAMGNSLHLLNEITIAVGIHGVLKQNHPFDEKLLDFYSGVYGRENEIHYLTQPTRHLSYECYMNDGNKILFTGCEVTQLEQIPKGMVAWEISQSGMKIYKDGGKSEIISNAPIKWEWKKTISAFGVDYTIGDFIASQMSIPELKLAEGPYTFCLTENNFIDYHQGNHIEDEIFLVEPDNTWANQYTEIETYLKKTLGKDLTLRIEHYGSTSIPNMPAKPVIDILVEVPSFETVRREIVPLLCSESCGYMFFMNHVTFTMRASFKGKRIAHIHMAPKEHEVWDGIAFRDYLRSHPKIAVEYANLKKELADKYSDDRNRYTMCKEELVKKATKDAIAWKTN